jgi:PHD/YefM family antitoxin component YafN of YafNO toxin-antitoxin module
VVLFHVEQEQVPKSKKSLRGIGIWVILSKESSNRKTMQIQLEDIHTLGEFQQNAEAHLSRVNQTRRPEILTINGDPAGVLLGTEEYDQLLSAHEELATLKSIQRGIDEMNLGQIVPAINVHEMLMKR